MKKKATMLLLITGILLSLFSPLVSAVDEDDIHYSGELKSYYVSPEEGAETAGSAARIMVTSDISYSNEDGMYYFKASDITSPFYSNVCDGMITQDPVLIHVPEGASITLFCDGRESAADINNITDVGTYVLQYQNNKGDKEQLISFTVVGNVTGLVNEYRIPEGFELVYLSKDNETLSVFGSTVSLQDEASYSIGYRCTNTGKDYTLNLQIDHTPPVLALAELEDGKCWGPVDVSDLEQGATIAAYRDGEPEKISDKKLTKSGRYTLLVTDAANNTTEYKFTIMIYLNAGSYIFFGIVLALIIAFVLYILISKRKFKVR